MTDMMRREHVWITAFFMFLSAFSFAQCDLYETAGSAVYDTNGCIQMTDTANQAGCAWQEVQMDFSDTLDLRIIFNFGTTDSAGAGLCMVFHKDTNGVNACGGSGSDLGVAGISPSFIIEFDTEQDTSLGEPEADHIAIDTNGNVQDPLSTFFEQANLEDSLDHLVRFTWDPVAMVYAIYLDSVLVTSDTFDIVNAIFGGDSLVYYGFTGGTAANGNTQLACPLATNIIDSLTFDICDNDSLVVNGVTYDSTDTYTQVFPLDNGCDSILIIDVTVSPTYDIENSFSLCEGDTLAFGGQLYDEAGTYVDTFQTVAGCDSITTLILTFLPTDTLLIQDTLCAGDTITINGEDYTMGGTYTQTIESTQGCDSLLLIDLAMVTSGMDTFATSICPGDTVNVNGEVYTEAGNYNQMIPVGGGCDSVLIILIDELPSVFDTVDLQFCEGDSIVVNGETYDSSGTYTQVVPLDFGCDSVLTINIDILPAFNSVMDVTLCEGDTITFGGNVINMAGTYMDSFQTADGCDSISTLILSLIPTDSVFIQDTLCAGDTIVINSVVYTEGGTYTQLFETVEGCDSLLVIDLELQSSGMDTFATSICSGDTVSVNGEVYTEAGNYTQMIPVGGGCDSVLIVLIDELPSVFDTVDLQFCEGDSIVVNGETYDSAGTYTQVIPLDFGCDSVLTINIDIVPAFNIVSDITLCEGDTIAFGGNLIGMSGTYVDTFQTADGCDSISTLILTLLPSDSTFIEESICAGDTAEVNGEIYTDAGTYTQFFESSQGCDSFLIIDVTILDGISDTVSASICPGDTITINGEVFTEAGTYNQSFPTASGCDSLLVIEIDELPTYSDTINADLCMGDSIVINGETFSQAGTFTQVFETDAGCDSTLTINISEGTSSTGNIDVAVVVGNSVEINGETFSEEGTYTQFIDNGTGCDSILIINVLVMRNIVFYDLDECHAVTGVTNNDYSEFEPDYKQPLNCADVEASVVYRENPDVNWHSCAPGVDGSIAMCISTVDSCNYVAGDEKSAKFDVTITPDENNSVQVVGLAFMERAPLEFSWVGGASGPNNYPTLYGIRVLKDGSEIFRAEDVATTNDWTLESYGFLNMPEFTVTESTTFTVEFLGYCRVQNGAEVAAWDLDNIRLLARCAGAPDSLVNIAGAVQTEEAKGVADVEIKRTLLGDPIEDLYAQTNALGDYIFVDNPAGASYELRGQKDDDPLNGVTTYDLALIQRHVLGFQSLTSPYKIIAADANGDNNIDILDIVLLRKIILGATPNFPDNIEWYFINADQALHAFNPWNFEQYIYYRNLETSVDRADFIGVKRGDINGDVKTSGDLSGDLLNDVDRAMLNIRTNPISAGDQVRIDITADNYERFVGMQLALNVQGIDQLNVVKGSISINDDNVYVEGNTVRISWNAVEEMEVNRGDVLFSITGVAQHSSTTGAKVVLEDGHMQAEFYDLNGMARSIGLDADKEETIVADVQISPNPAYQSTILTYTAPEAGDVRIAIYDAAGKLVVLSDQTLQAGKHDILISRAEVGGAGIYMCQIHTSKGIFTKRLVFML